MPCRVCLVDHDPEIHEATLRVHAWLRHRLGIPREVVEGPKTSKPNWGKRDSEGKTRKNRPEIATAG